MGQGFQERINAIVDSIVSLEKEKNKKIDKDGIADSIKSSISDLNDIGQILVLEDLEKEAGQTPSNLLTIDGKISEEKLREVVDAKIKEAEREGIDLKGNAKRLLKNSKVSIADGIITMATIDLLVNNFKDLTPAERTILRESYEYLNEEQRAKYDKGMIDKIDETMLSDEKKEELKTVFSDDFHKSISSIITALQKKYGNNYQDKLSEVSQNEISLIIDSLEISDTLKGELKKQSMPFLLKIEKARQERADLYIQLDKAKKEGNIEEEKRLDAEIAKIEDSEAYRAWEHIDNVQKLDAEIAKIEDSEVYRAWEHIDNVQNIEKNMQQEAQENFQELPDEKIDEQSLNDNISQEIQKIPISLAEEFSKQEIKEALDKYNFILGNLDEEDIEALKEQTLEQVKETLSDAFQNFEDELSPNAFKALQQMASFDFDGNLQQILTNPELLQETFLPVIEAEIQKLEQPERAGTEQDEQSFEASEVAQPQEQTSATFNQETIRDELSAIPVALSNIEGIDRADIISGMQGYKQLLDSIDVSSLQGKSNDEVLQILMSKTAEIGLEGNANEILLMMSQIGFSKDGNMQIADILTTSKDVFTALVDEASKEENINKAIQENQAQTPITDREATPGMRLLIEDLSFAKENENQLGEQVVANDGNVSDSVSSSDTDAAQGTTSTGKLKVGAIEKHVQDRKMSGITSQFDLISEIIKNEEKGKDSQEQETTEGPEV